MLHFREILPSIAVSRLRPEIGFPMIRNEDGRWNDELTHAGVVVGVDRDGTITHVHHNYRRGVVTARMNLRAP